MKWLRSLTKSKAVESVFAFLAAWYIRFVFFTSRWQTQGSDHIDQYIKANKPLIICFWHGRLGMLVQGWTWRTRPVHMLLSNHRDGRLIGKTIGHFQISTISGSTQRGGTQALRQLIATLQKGGIIGITPDGPRGPNQVVSQGVITLSKLAQVDIIPVTYSISRSRRLKTWDRFLFPLPFGRGIYLIAEPISYPKTDDLEKTRLQLETAMNEQQDLADTLIMSAY